MDWTIIGLEFFSGFFEFLVAVVFLVLSYKFSTLWEYYKVDAFKELSLGFRFVFIAYFIPIVGVFIGSIVVLDPNEYFELIFAGTPYYVSMIVAFIFFFKSIKSIIRYANA